MNKKVLGMGVVSREAIQKLSLFANVKEETVQQLVKYAKVNQYKKGSYIFRDKEMVDQVYIILYGKVSISKLGESGEGRVIFILDQGHLLNDHLKSQLPSAVDCICFEKCEILSYSRERFLSMMEQDFELAQAVLDQFCSKLRRTYRQLKNAPTNIAMERKLAAKLYRLYHDYGVEVEGEYIIDVPLTVSYLSQLLGAQRETVSRALKKLVEADLVQYERKKIKIKSPEALGNYHKNK